MKKEKGFTLIELLAVIALIASPLIINVIENVRMKAFENSVYGVMSTYDIKTIGDKEAIGKTYSFPEGNSELLYSGTKMIGGSIFLTPSGSIEVRRITDGRYCASGNKTNLVIKRGDCNIDLVTAPVLKTFNTTGHFLYIGLEKHKIESIEIVMVSEFPEGSVDVSDKGNGKVMLWTKDEDNNEMLEVYIGAIDDVVYANSNSKGLFDSIQHIKKINLSNFDTMVVTDMQSMFYGTGIFSASFELHLGNSFDTSNVTNMRNMFYSTGQDTINFTLNLGDKFDTSNVIDMQGMFMLTGRDSSNFILDLGDKFDTTKVRNMRNMFNYLGYNSAILTLKLGSNFDTSNVTDMQYMFDNIGYNSTNFTLNLGNKFDTSKVTNMRNMFANVGRNNQDFTLDLGEKFDSNSVSDMQNMFVNAGHNSTSFTLNLGEKFDTSNVTNMQQIFYGVGRNDSNFALNLGNKFNVDKVTNMLNSFGLTGNANPSFKPTASVKTQAEKDAILTKFPNIEVTIKP